MTTGGAAAWSWTTPTLGPWSECTICDLSALCYYQTCHNDGHWVEVDFPDAADQADCRDQCIASGVATAFQYNDGGWCGCMILDGVTFDEAMASEQHLGPAPGSNGSPVAMLPAALPL